MKYVMFYELATDGLSKVQANFPAHQARLKEFHQNGTLLMAGPYGAPPMGALAIFTSREAAEAFIAGDPFVTKRGRRQVQHPRMVRGAGTMSHCLTIVQPDSLQRGICSASFTLRYKKLRSQASHSAG